MKTKKLFVLGLLSISFGINGLQGAPVKSLLATAIEEGDVAGVKNIIELYPTFDPVVFNYQEIEAALEVARKKEPEEVEELIASQPALDSDEIEALKVARAKEFNTFMQKVESWLKKEIELEPLSLDPESTRAEMKASEILSNAKWLLKKLGLNEIEIIEYLRSVPEDIDAEAKVYLDVAQGELELPEDMKSLKVARDIEALKNALENEDLSELYDPVAWEAYLSTTNAEQRNRLLRNEAQEGNAFSVKRLVKAGAEVNAQNQHGYTALMFAAREGNVEVVNLLLNHGSEVNSQNVTGYTALMFAAHLGNVEVVNLLLDHGAEANARDIGSYTALMFAARSGNVEVVNLLLDHGAEVNARDNHGSTALRKAILSNHAAVENLLREHGATE